MEWLMLVVLLLALWRAGVAIRGRFEELEQRVDSLEQTVTELQRPAKPAAVSESVREPAPRLREQPPVVARTPATTPVAAPTSMTAPIGPLRVIEPSGPAWSERLRSVLGSEEWEALVGGSLLNKAGVLVLVVGIALFLAYSFGRMTPGGRIALSFAAGSGILASGVWLERRDWYRVFARGLIGAGWATLYATAYAAYALPAARIIDNRCSDHSAYCSYLRG